MKTQNRVVSVRLKKTKPPRQKKLPEYVKPEPNKPEIEKQKEEKIKEIEAKKVSNFYFGAYY